MLPPSDKNNVGNAQHVIAITPIGSDATYMHSEPLGGSKETAMRKHISFAIAATVLVLAVVFWTLGVAGWNAANQANVAPPTRSLQMM